MSRAMAQGKIQAERIGSREQSHGEQQQKRQGKEERAES